MDFKCGVYRHYKGNKYLVLGIAKHSETLEDPVYVPLYDNPKSKLWVRPLNMFLEEVVVEGKKMKRFEYLGQDQQS